MSRHRFDPAQSQLVLDGRSSLHAIRGTIGGVNGWIELDERGALQGGHVTAEVDRTATGNPVYDREIRNRLEVEKFPTFEAELRTASLDSDGATNLVGGTVTAHGVEVALAGSVQIVERGDCLHLTGDEQIDFRRFGLKAPRILALKVDPIITVALDVITFPPD